MIFHEDDQFMQSHIQELIQNKVANDKENHNTVWRAGNSVEQLEKRFVYTKNFVRTEDIFEPKKILRSMRSVAFSVKDSLQDNRKIFTSIEASKDRRRVELNEKYWMDNREEGLAMR